MGGSRRFPLGECPNGIPLHSPCSGQLPSQGRSAWHRAHHPLLSAGCVGYAAGGSLLHVRGE
jgi:hypothetical protein